MLPEEEMKIEPVDRWIINPMRRFISNSTMSGIVLFSSATVAMILSNSPWSHQFHNLWAHQLSIGYDNYSISKDLHHWINDGLMAIFFFVVGLELKREIVAGELRDPRQAVLPVVAALGGMLVPAFFYWMFNSTGEAANGWGIPMATDIAFALGILYLLGDRVPLSLKIFLTVLAIADDLGAVLVIAFFYTSKIDVESLIVGGALMSILIIANRIGVRNAVFYALIGIGGVWLAFLVSGVHPTIAAVLVAFTIPATAKISSTQYSKQLQKLMARFKNAADNDQPIVTTEQFHLLNEIKVVSKNALTPLQRLEHGLHPFVAFIVMPIFALSNAGVELSSDWIAQLQSPVAFGVSIGLLAGKVIGVVGVTYLLLFFKWVDLPEGLNHWHVWGAGFLAAIGFTMSLFISGLAFKNSDYVLQAKLGILAASLLASVVGYLLIRRGNKAGV